MLTSDTKKFLSILSVYLVIPVAIVEIKKYYIITNSIKSNFTECLICTQPQQPEINDQFTTKAVYDTKEVTDEAPKKVDIMINNEIQNENQKNAKLEDNRKYFAAPHNEVVEVETNPSFWETIYEILTKPISIFFSSPKVSFVLGNVGTCIVNGAMEIVSHYFPAPLIPLIASAAGMVLPFEPVVMLKERMPVTSYRRAFGKAMNSFLNTFDAYKMDSIDDDPYMTRRFNRRFMNDISGEIKKKHNGVK